MNALFRILSREEYARLNLEQKMVYLHALAADLKDEVKKTSHGVDAEQQTVALVRRQRSSR